MRISSEINELGSLPTTPPTSSRYCVQHLLQSHLRRLVPHSPRRGSNRVGAGSRSMVTTTSWMMRRSVSPAQITKHLASQILFHVKPPLSHDLSSGQGASTAFTEDATNVVARFFSFSLRCRDEETRNVLFSCPIPTRSCARASMWRHPSSF